MPGRVASSVDRALAAAAAFTLFAHILCRFLPPLQTGVVVGAVPVLSMSHLLARPHVLALPVMIAWASGLVSASGRGKAPALLLLAARNILALGADVQVFIESRAELYGEQFVLAYNNALQLQDVGQFLALLDTYRIDATLLGPLSPAVHLLDRLDGWRRVYSDGEAEVHMQVVNTAPKIRPALD